MPKTAGASKLPSFFTATDMQKLIDAQEFKPDLFTLDSERDYVKLLKYWNALNLQRGGFRKQCIIFYHGHWFGMDLQGVVE